MEERTSGQVYRDPIFLSLDPKGKHFMGMKVLPNELNPFMGDEIKIVALIPFGVFPHIKTVPTVQMMRDDFEKGRYRNKHTIVVDSSGNTAHAVARLARAFGFKKVKAYVPGDVPDSKAGILSAFGNFVDVLKVARPAEAARQEGRKRGHYHLNQYSHKGNMRAHQLYTGPEILRALGNDATDIGVIAIAMGSGGTLIGVNRYFKKRHAKTIILGVRPKDGEQVPGARDKRRMEDIVTLPWETSAHHFEEISRKESFERMRRLWSVVDPQPGPTSGLAWGGLEQWLKNQSPETLAALSGKYAAFLCPDDGRFYPERTTGELDPEQGTI